MAQFVDLLRSHCQSLLPRGSFRHRASARLAWLPVALASACNFYDLDFGDIGEGSSGGGDSVQCRVDNDCPQVPCPCLDSDGDGACENHCPTMGCVDNECVDVSAPQFDFCGGLVGAGCADDEFCLFEEGARCGAGGQTGQCEVRPEVCPAIARPVCGCDGETYGNECVAAAAGVSVLAQGACLDGPPDIGSERPALTGAECTALGGVVIGDIGNGAIHRPDFLCENGEPPLGTFAPEPGGPIPTEGAVCCPQ